MAVFDTLGTQDRFFGKPVDYWLTLQRRIEELGFDRATALDTLMLDNIRLERLLNECLKVLKNFEAAGEQVSDQILKLEQLARTR